jgi:dTDP-4-amino-4,6-dideoxygalactose transaminase
LIGTTLSLTVPYVDIAGQHAPLRAELLAAVAEVIDSGAFVLGPQVATFEERFAALCGVRFAIGVGNGTDALVLALRALDIGPGDEVITPPNSFVASTSCIRLVGAKPVFVDVGADYLIDPARIEAAITPRTKAIVPVHLTGRACDMTAIRAIAERHGLAIVEDCAQAILAEHRGTRVGALGTIGCFSLHPLKTLNACGDGGMLVTDDPEIAQRLGRLRNLGLRTRDDCTEWAGNSRLDTVQAAMLLVKLRYLDGWTRARQANAQRYRDALGDIAGLVLPQDVPGDVAVYHTFVALADERDALRAFLAERNIGTQIHYPTPIHLTNAARELGHARGDFPVTEAQAERIVSFPVYDTLSPEAHAHTCEQIRAFYLGSGRVTR